MAFQDVRDPLVQHRLFEAECFDTYVSVGALPVKELTNLVTIQLIGLVYQLSSPAPRFQLTPPSTNSYAPYATLPGR